MMLTVLPRRRAIVDELRDQLRAKSGFGAKLREQMTIRHREKAYRKGEGNECRNRAGNPGDHARDVVVAHAISALPYRS